jgi:hypothetical protein
LLQARERRIVAEDVVRAKRFELIDDEGRLGVKTGSGFYDYPG